MNTISFQIDKENENFLNGYLKENNLNINQFINSLIEEKLEEESYLDEQQILEAVEQSKTDKKYTHEEVWKILGI